MPGTLVMSFLACAMAGGFAVEPGAASGARDPLRLELHGLGSARTPQPDLALDGKLLLATTRLDGDSVSLAPPPDDLRVEHLRHSERVLKWSTAGALVVTSVLGTMVAINQPTAFGDGRCQTGSPLLGTYGCDRGLSTLHGISGVLSLTLYTADGVLTLAIPGPVGNVSEAARPWHRALTYVTLGGFVVQPILGLVAAYPQVIGMTNAAPGDAFPRDVRTIHVGLGYLITAAFLTTLALEQ